MTEIESYEDVLRRIEQLAISWNANQMGGVSHQRKRWQLLGRIAKEALSEQAMQRKIVREASEKLKEQFRNGGA